MIRTGATPSYRPTTTEETDMKMSFRLAERSSDSRVRPTWNPTQREADALARCTGSRSVTVRHERREADGSLTVLAEATSAPRHTCDLGPGSPILATNRGTCPACP